MSTARSRGSASLISYVKQFSGQRATLDICDELRDWSPQAWREALLDLPTDSLTFAAYFECSWDEQIQKVQDWLDHFQNLEPTERSEARERVFGHLALLLITLTSLRHSEQYRSGQDARSAAAPGINERFHECAQACQSLVRLSAVRSAIRDVYAPPGGLARDSQTAAVQKEWADIDFDTLEFHRHGTTSFILTGQVRRGRLGQRPRFALKCIVYPYLRLPVINRSTKDYAVTYRVTDQQATHLTRVWASCERWILMEFIEGLTLTEWLQEQAVAKPEIHSSGALPRLDLDQLETLGNALFEALEELERSKTLHGDLSPSNIIMASGARKGFYTFKLIDFGANYLHTHSLTGNSGPDAAYIAPEVRGGDLQCKSDLYSLGQLLVAFAGVGRTADATVPDGFYVETALMARFVEDLIDRDPDRRLLLFPLQNGSAEWYPQLRAYFQEELSTARAVRGPGPPKILAKLGVGPVAELVMPLRKAPQQQWRLWRARRKQQNYRQKYVRWLLFWSLVSAVSWYVDITILVMWCLRDMQSDWVKGPIKLLQKLTGSPKDEFPFLDSLRTSSYPIPDLFGNLPARLVCLSFALAAPRYYQGLFAGITPLAGGKSGRLGRRALAAEISMRAGTTVPSVLILSPTLVDRQWWPICTALGITYTFVCNVSCRVFARAAIRQARQTGLSTVPADRIPGLENYYQWASSSALYCCCVWFFAVLIVIGTLHDVIAYAASVAVINVVLFYLIKCGLGVAPVRVGLSRACLAAERLRRQYDSATAIAGH